MAKKKKQATITSKYDPNTKLGRYIQDSGEYLDHLPTKGYYINQQQQKALQRKTALKEYLAQKEKENRINAGRKAIQDNISRSVAQSKFQKTMVDTDPFGKRLQAMKEGKALAKVPALTYEESKALGRYTVGKKTGSNTPGVQHSEDSKVYRSKEDIAAAYNAERKRRQAEYDAWKEEQRKNNKLTKSATAADKTGQSMGDYLAGIKQKKEEKSKGTAEDWKRATQGSSVMANNQNLAYGAKMAGLSPEEFVQQLQGTNKQLTQQEQKDNRAASLIKGKTDLGHWMGGTTEDVQQTMRAGYASGFRTDYDRLKEQGYFDEGEDPYLMSDEGRANLRAKNEAESAIYQAKIDELTAQAEGMTPLNTGRERQARLLEAYITPEIENELTIINGEGYTEEEKKNARIRLQELRSQAAYGAGQFLQSGFLSMVNDKSQLPVVRRELYDSMYGRGAYEQATAGMTEEERAALDGRLDDTYYAVSDPYGVVGKDLRTYKALLENAQGQIATIDKLTQQDAKYAEMMAGVDELGDVEIDPATVGTSRNSLLQNQYTPAAPVEYVAAILSGDYNEDVWINDLQYGQALLMSDDEKKKFADLYNNGKKNEAWAFYQGLEPMLNQMYHYFEDLSIRQTARRIPITSSIATEAMHLAQPVEALINLPEQLASAVFDTGSGVTDPYSSRYLVTRLKNGIRAQVAEDVVDWDWVYNGFTSGVDSALNVSIGKALGLNGKFLNIAGKKIPAMQAATLALFHTQAFETSLQNTLTQGNDNFGYDFIEAWIDAAVETATEIWSVENWMADPTNILRYVGKIAISEPSEEIVGAIIEPYIKEMLGHKNQYKERAKQILVDGGYTDGQGNWVKVEDMDTATRQAMREWNHDIRMAAQEALMSVGPSIVYGSARMATDTNRTGRAIQSNNINGEQNATRELAEAAARMNPETESYKQSQKMLERLKNGEQISNYDAGKLATNIIRETNEQIGNTARQVLQDRVAEDLQSKGMQAEEAQEFAGLITSALEEGGIDNLTQKQRSKINGNNAALQTYMSYRFSAETQNKTAKAQLEATKGDRQSRFTVEALMMDRKTNDNLDVGEQMSTEQERKEAQGKVVQGTMGIVYNQQNAKLGSMVLDADGKPKYQVYIEGQQEPVLADSTEIRANHMGTAAIIQSQATNPEFYSQGYTNVLLQAMNDKRMENKPGILMRDAMLLRYAAYEQMGLAQTELPADIARNLYEYSQAEYIARRAADTQNAKRSKLQPGQGYATYKGYRSGSAEFNKALKQSGLSKADQQYVRTIADLAKAMGAELTLTDNEEIVNSQNGELAQFKDDPSKLYGAEKKSRITVNLGGMNFARNLETGKIEATGQRHNVVVTFGHEAVHFLQENTREGFDNLAQYVLNEQRNKLGTQGLNDRLDKIMHDQGVDLYGAISELVADSCDNIFSSQEVIDHIQQTNKGLYQNLKNFAKNMITRLRNAIKGSMSADSQRLGNQVGSRLAKLFNLAWDEAANRELVYDEKAYQKALDLIQNAEKHPVAKFSMSETVEVRDDGLMAVHNLHMNNLMKLIKMGGIAMPSVGVINSNDYWTNFGDVSLFLDRSFVDMALKQGRAFAGDAFTAVMQNDTNTAEEALQQLRNQPERRLAPQNLFMAFLDYQKVRSIDQMRNRTSLKLTDEQRRSVLRELNEKQRAVEDEIKDTLIKGLINEQGMAAEDAETYMAEHNSAIDAAIGRAALLAVENIEQQQENGKNIWEIDTYGIIAEELNNAFEQMGLNTESFGFIDNDAIEEAILDYANYAEENLPADMMEIKPDTIVTFDQVSAILLPQNIDQSIVQALVDAGMNPDAIRYYTDRENRIAQMKNIPQQVEGVRFSQAQVDNDYLTAVENGDKQTQRQILDEAAKKNGYTMKVYHGTPTGGFTVFRDWSYFTEKKEYADRYNHPSQSSTRGYAVDATQPMTYELYMNPGRVFDTRNSKEAKLFEQIRMEYGMSQLTDNGLPDWTDGRDLIEYIEENNLPYDTIILNEGADGGYGAPVVSRGESYVSRSNMVKSTELVTRDDEGNVIPPSERFNADKNDIRWSRAQVEETKDLVAYHNLGAEQLAAVLRLGGFAMPSIAITRDNYMNDRYGDISVVFKKDTIDPKKSSANKVYGGDAWTPVYPTVEYKISEKKMDAVREKVSKLVPSEYQIRLYELDADNVEKAVNSRRGDIVQAVKDNTNLMAAYLADQGKDVQYPMREKKLDGFNKFANEQVIRAYNLLGEDTINQAYVESNTWNYLTEHPEIVEALRQEMNAYWKEELDKKVSKDTKLKLLDKELYTADNFGKNEASKLIEAAYKYMKKGIQQELDQYALKDYLREQVDDEGYEKWLKNLLSGAIEKSGIRNNKDYFDRMGNRRSWETLHDPETLENVVRVMRNELDKGATGFFSQSELLALGTKDFKSLDEIRKDKGRLQHISDEEMSAAKTDIINRFDALVTALADPKASNPFIERDNVFGAIADAVRDARTVDGIKRIMNEWQHKITDAQAQEIADLMVEISNLPTEYFEAKPKRAVGLDEIAKVIVPENVEQELLDAMDEQGIPWEYYNGTSEDRLAKMNATPDVKFSRWTEDGLDVNTWMMNATPSTFQTEDEQALWQAYKDLRIKMSLSLHRQNEYQAKIKQLESKANLTAEERDELTANRNRLEIQKKKLADMEDELYQVTSSEGYAGMMYRQNMVLKDYIQGKTQDQVRQTVEGMLKEVQRAQEEIKKDRADLLKLAETQAVKTVESYMSKSSLGKMAGMLRSNYNSAMSKGEIQSRLAEMALKQAQGEDITSEAEQLAQDLLDKMRGIQTDALQQLKGTTLRISEELAKEMRAENLTMADLRRQLKGSGVTIKTEKGANIRQQWAEMYDKNQSLPNIDEDYSESGALHHILDFIQGEVDASRGVNQNEVNFDEVAAVVKIAAGNITTYLVDDPAARRQIENLMGQVKELAGKTGAIAEKMDEVVLAGQKAKGWTTILQRDVNDAIKYYNKTARVAAQVEKTKVRKALIEQLRSENTKKLLAQQDAFKERMKNDKTARELAQDNMIIRRKINTVAGRMAQRLFAETDQKNIPEETKALARQMMQMLTMNDSLHRKVTFMDRQQLRDIMERLQKLAATEGTFNADTDLNWLIIGEGQDADTSLVDRVMQDLVDIESGLLEYRTAEGQKNVTLQDRKNALLKVQKALSEIWSMIQARGQAQIRGRKMQILDLAMMMEEDMADSAFKGERTGFGRKARNAISGAINYGNLTPEYFFKNLKNRAMDQLKLGLNDAENSGGLEAAKAKAKIAQLAAETGFNSWDGQEKHEIDVANGKKVTATTEQIMSLYATWLRERNATRPEETAHLLKGGFVLTPNEEGGKPGRQKTVQRPIRITWNQLNKLGSYLTEEQKRWVDGVVAYMSGELAELGNEASMQMYGIKKFTEKYYFPIRSWGGVLNSRSDAGVSSQNENRAAQQSFTKRIKANANNAVQISDFTPTAMKHITGMITFNTIGPAVENINKVLNQQLTYDENKGKHEGLPTEENEELDTSYKRNMAAAFQENYGKQAYDYLKTFMKDLNGGFARRQEVLLREKLLSIFKKNAVAGSLSVAAQQPLSYIRAAMMINPKYLAAAISPQYWKGSYAEMMKYSGLAVIKEMGKFDMNYGQTMQDYIAPEGIESKARRAWNKVSDVMTAGPQKMDAMTWTRMWTAVKLEQMAQNKGADFKSDEFLTKVAERFNDLMRRTQVYDSVMVKSQNMRSDNYLKKVATSFMAEPTLSLNVLEDAWANRKESGGKKNVIKALATFLLSAAAQAGAKAFFGTGRTPDKKKNKEENFLNKFGYNILSEVNPLSLIPGYSQIINVLTDGELKDDAMGMLGKAVEVWDRIFQLATGKIGDKGLYRDLEDSIGQLLQLTTDIPAKNLMRDFRAMVNFFSNGEAQGFTGDGYAHRPTSNAVLKYQALDTFMSNDLIGLINKRLGEAGYGTSNKDYYTRIYNAERSGNQAAADEMKEYLLQGKGVNESTMNSAIRKMYTSDENVSSAEKLEKSKEYGLKQTTTLITDEYAAGNLSRAEAEKLYRQENPKATDKDVLKMFDKIDWEKAGNDAEGYTNYTPLMTAIENNKVDEIRAAVDHMVKNRYTEKDIRSEINSRLKKEYMAAANEKEKLRIRDALTKTYKALGYDASDADKTVQKWIDEAKKNK